MVLLLIFSTSLSYVSDLLPISSVGLSVCVSVCLSGKSTVAKWLIGSGCRLGWWAGVGEWGRSRDGCIR